MKQDLILRIKIMVSFIVEVTFYRAHSQRPFLTDKTIVISSALEKSI